MKKIILWLKTYRCTCGIKLYESNTEVTNENYLEHTLCEYDVKCKNCGKVVGHWAYGYYQPPVDKFDEVKMRFYNFKYKIIKLFRR